MFRDWYIFYQASKAIGLGLSPYSVEGYFNPVQLAWLLSPTTIIPFEKWVFISIGFSMLGVVVLCRKKSHWVLLSLPFIFGMTMGSMDVLLWVPGRLLGGAGLSLLTLKPQLGIIVLPLQLASWIREKNIREISNFSISVIFLWGIPTLFHPRWFIDWLSALPSIKSRLHGAASIAGFETITGGWIFYIAFFILVIFCLIYYKSNAYYLAASFSPAFWPSDWIITAEFITWRFTVLSWLLVLTGIGINGAQFYFFLGILIWHEQNPSVLRQYLIKLKIINKTNKLEK